VSAAADASFTPQIEQSLLFTFHTMTAWQRQPPLVRKQYSVTWHRAATE
jgi:hypothetical protein